MNGSAAAALKGVMIAVVMLSATGRALAFDQSHAAWDALLKRHVAIALDGNSSRVDHAGCARSRAPYSPTWTAWRR